MEEVGAGHRVFVVCPRIGDGSDDDAVHLDVGIHPIPRGGTRVEVDELPPPVTNPPSADELIRRFEEEQRRLD